MNTTRQSVFNFLTHPYGMAVFHLFYYLAIFNVINAAEFIPKTEELFRHRAAPFNDSRDLRLLAINREWIASLEEASEVLVVVYDGRLEEMPLEGGRIRLIPKFRYLKFKSGGEVSFILDQLNENGYIRDIGILNYFQKSSAIQFSVRQFYLVNETQTKGGDVLIVGEPMHFP